MSHGSRTAVLSAFHPSSSCLPFCLVQDLLLQVCLLVIRLGEVFWGKERDFDKPRRGRGGAQSPVGSLGWSLPPCHRLGRPKRYAGAGISEAVGFLPPSGLLLLVRLVLCPRLAWHVGSFAWLSINLIARYMVTCSVACMTRTQAAQALLCAIRHDTVPCEAASSARDRPAPKFQKMRLLLIYVIHT
jgi:hypothetical protein